MWLFQRHLVSRLQSGIPPSSCWHRLQPSSSFHVLSSRKFLQKASSELQRSSLPRRNFFRKGNNNTDQIRGRGRVKNNADAVVRSGQEPELQWSSLVRPLAFTVGFGGAAFAGAAIWQYENMRQVANYKKRLHGHWQKAGDLWKQFSTNMEEINKVGEWRRWLNSVWNNELTEGQRVFVPLLALNVLVFAAWRLPSLQPTMIRYFTSSPTKGNPLSSMILSAFSHVSPLHLACNMYVLHSFCTPVVAALGKEEFIGLYLSSGVFASLCSHAAKVAFNRPGPSVGASGAICAVLGLFCTLVPDAQLQIVFLPWLTFTSGTAIKAMMALDSVGLVMGWALFDHAAHLGGVLMGIWWVHKGHSLVWEKRGKLMEHWHQIREAVSSSK